VLDGTRCRDDLIAHLSALTRDGGIVVRDANGEPLLDEERLREVAARSVDRCLRSLGRAGMLE
jgi:hypothetical protein